MPSIRKLLSPKALYEIEEIEIPLNCINGYFIENTTICICYPGWTSVYNDLDRCTIDSGANNSNAQKKEGVIYSKDAPKDKGISTTVVIFLIFLILVVLGIFCAIFMCLFKKYKDIKLVKEKIKFEKKRNKTLNNGSNSGGEKGKDINDERNNKESEKNDICLGVLSESDLKSNIDKENKE